METVNCVLNTKIRFNDKTFTVNNSLAREENVRFFYFIFTRLDILTTHWHINAIALELTTFNIFKSQYLSSYVCSAAKRTDFLRASVI